MALNKVKIGSLIAEYNLKNTENCSYPFYGINILKEFMPSVANTDNVDKSKYKLVSKGVFVFSGMQTGRDNCIRIGLFDEDKTVLISPAYTTFKVVSDLVLPEYLFMIFKSTEKDRFGAFLSDGSIRSNLDWEVFCNIELDLPSIEIQKKYVAIYNSMVANLRSYEKNLDELKLVCEGYIEDLRKNRPISLKGHLIESTEKNELLLAKSEKGVSIQKVLIDTKAKSSDITKQKLVRKGYFAFNSNTSRNSETISIALNRDEPCAVSNTYIVFSSDNHFIPEYLYLWFKRKEFDRYARFNSWGSARETLSLEEIEFAIVGDATIEEQTSIVNILQVLEKRQNFIVKLKEQIKQVCPVLIRGAVLEGEK